MADRAVMPTLMGSPVQGSAGVKVWSPDRRAALREVKGGLFILAVFSAPMVWLSGRYPASPLLGPCLAMSFPYTVALMNWLKPTRIVMDDHGMAVTTWRGSRAIAWADLVELRELSFNPWWPVAQQKCLRLVAARPVTVSVSCFSPDTQNEIASAIVNRAHLRRSGKGRYLRPQPGTPALSPTSAASGVHPVRGANA